MVKFKATGDRNLIGLGLSEENVKRLKEGMPIFIEKEKLEIPFDILIFYGKTEKDIENDLKTVANFSEFINDK
jgi:hypothetical protein